MGKPILSRTTLRGVIDSRERNALLEREETLSQCTRYTQKPSRKCGRSKVMIYNASLVYTLPPAPPRRANRYIQCTRSGPAALYKTGTLSSVVLPPIYFTR